MKKRTFTTLEKLTDAGILPAGMGLKQVQGEPMTIRLGSYHVQAFVYKRADGFWSVTECNSGAMLAQASTRKYAVNLAYDRCIAAGPDRVKENIAAAMRYTCRKGITDGQPINPVDTTDYTPRGF